MYGQQRHKKAVQAHLHLPPPWLFPCLFMFIVSFRKSQFMRHIALIGAIYGTSKNWIF